MKLIVVDGFDQEQGQLDKLTVHQQGMRHRAFSIMLGYREQGQKTRWLIQQRADSKYHSGGLWSNSCCSHPLAGEDILTTMPQRLTIELGLPATEAENIELKFCGKFEYQIQFDDLSEHEIDHVYLGYLPNKIDLTPNPAEVQALRWLTLSEILAELSERPANWSIWMLSVANLAGDHVSSQD